MPRDIPDDFRQRFICDLFKCKNKRFIFDHTYQELESTALYEYFNCPKFRSSCDYALMFIEKELSQKRQSAKVAYFIIKDGEIIDSLSTLSTFSANRMKFSSSCYMLGLSQAVYALMNNITVDRIPHISLVERRLLDDAIFRHDVYRLNDAIIYNWKCTHCHTTVH